MINNKIVNVKKKLTNWLNNLDKAKNPFTERAGMGREM